MHVGDSPAPAHLDDALELAEILRPTWPALREENRRTAAFLNEGEEDGGEGGDQPSPDGADSPETPENNGGDEGNQASFLDAYDLGEVTDPQARAVTESFLKRVQAGYTRQRQADAQAVAEAQQANQILEGLYDPDRAPAILQALGVNVGAPEGNELGDEFEFEDPNERIDALERQLAERDEVSAAERRAQAENAYVTEGITAIQTKLARELGDPEFELGVEEIGLLSLLADENRDENGAPDVEAAERLLDAVVAERQARALKPRRRPARRPGQGRSGEQQVDLDDPEKRIEAGIAKAMEVLASSE